MKKTTLIFVLIFVSSLYAQGLETIVVPAFNITSQEKNKRIKKEFFQISGKLRLSSGKKDYTGIVITNSGQTKTFSFDTSGAFRAEFPVSDSIVYFYKPGEYEVIGRFPEDRNQVSFEVEVLLPDIVPIQTEKALKPAIYLYNVSPTALSLKPNGKVTFSYPVLEGEWKVSSDQNGEITDLKSMKTYPYLFWEADIDGLEFLQPESESYNCYYLKSEEVVSFLEKELETGGLNQREIADFITFWVPRMQGYDQIKLQFLVDQDYDRVAQLNCSDESIRQRRVYLLFEELEEIGDNHKNTPVEWSNFDRSGPTLLEWGGTDLTKSKSL